MSSQQPVQLDNPVGKTSPGKRLALIGGGNIGSAMVCLLPRMGGIATVLVVDSDVYEAKNLSCQSIFNRDIGRPKAEVQARRMRRVNPAIQVQARRSRVEDLPLGELGVDAILSCVDSRSARRYINQAAWRLGVPWIDGAVDASGLLVRVNAYVPGPDVPCMECTWDDEDYDRAALEQPYACQKGVVGPTATNAPASLGSVCAGIMALECRKLLLGEFDTLLAGRQIMLDLRHHTHFVTSFTRRASCRFDHESWCVEQPECLTSQTTLGEVFGLMGDGQRSTDDRALRVEGQCFSAMKYCPACGHHEQMPLHLAGRLPSFLRRCACGQTMTVRGFDQHEWVAFQLLDGQDLARPLAALGVETHDVLSVHDPSGTRHFLVGQLGGDISTVGPAVGRPLSNQSAPVQGEETSHE